MREINLVNRYSLVYKKDIRFEYRDILRVLFESQNGLLPFSLYSKLGVEPEIILDFIEKYKSQGIITVSDDGNRIALTESGRKDFHSTIKDLELSAGFASDSFLNRLRFPSTNKYTPYVPSYNEGDKDVDTF